MLGVPNADVGEAPAGVLVTSMEGLVEYGRPCRVRGRAC